MLKGYGTCQNDLADCYGYALRLSETFQSCLDLLEAGRERSFDANAGCRIERLERSSRDALFDNAQETDALETKMYPDRRILFGSGVPVTIRGGDSQEVRKLLGRHGLRCPCHWSTCFLKEVPQPWGRDDHGNQRFDTDVAPGMPCAAGHMDVISRFPDDPFVGLSVLLERLYLAGEDKEVLCVRMTVQWNRDTRRDHASQDTEVIVRLARRGQKLDCWSEEIDDQAGSRIDLRIHLFLSFW
jgi:hypothetical protein